MSLTRNRFRISIEIIYVMLYLFYFMPKVFFLFNVVYFIENILLCNLEIQNS